MEHLTELLVEPFHVNAKLLGDNPEIECDHDGYASFLY